jgi:predicted dehydrogenase
MTEVSGFSKSGFWRTKWGADTNEDEAFLTVRFKSGQLMTLRASSIESNPPPRMFEITGTKGALVMGYSDWKLITHSKNDSVITETGKCPPAQWPEYYRNIAGFLRGKEKLVITPELARRPIHIIELAGLSARKGRAMKTKHP